MHDIQNDPPSYTFSPQYLLIGRKEATTWLKQWNAPLHMQRILQSTRDYACELLLVFQGQVPFDTRAKAPWITIIEDDAFAALGPTGFDLASLERLFGESSFFGIIETSPIKTPYDIAATYAAKYRKNAVIIHTQPEHRQAWGAIVNRVKPDSQVLFTIS